MPPLMWSPGKKHDGWGQLSTPELEVYGFIVADDGGVRSPADAAGIDLREKLNTTLLLIKKGPDIRAFIGDRISTELI